MSDPLVFLTALIESIETGQPLPEFPANLSIEQAYDIQQQLGARVHGGKIAGIKAGLSSVAVREMFGLDAPLLGVLYAARELACGASFPVRPNTSIECEIGIVVNAAGEVISAGPAIELVAVEFSQPSDFSAANLLAANLAADQFIRGPQSAWCDSYQDIEVNLYRDGSLVNTASLMEAIGGPHEALEWMLTEAKQRGYKTPETYLVMTGNCGDLVAAEPGDYRADYGVLGSVEFSVSDS